MKVLIFIIAVYVIFSKGNRIVSEDGTAKFFQTLR